MDKLNNGGQSLRRGQGTQSYLSTPLIFLRITDASSMYILICLSLATISYLASAHHDTFYLEILVKIPDGRGLNSISPFSFLFLTTSIRASSWPWGSNALPSLVAFKVGLGNPGGGGEPRLFQGVHEVKTIFIILR